ncbi:hypothetical protein C3B58_05410 [Lactonifactor longoviformis]|uniref:Putative cell wall binding repeat-containing protein n=1 Tax=Lactonifactor longoviformis DSM 17459 TaxID=1122155 RepID=A0A1M4Z093_9CLOT|nr:bacterial Ig-like domain-containing protein [Lactonifactor longoviformis]POP33880.1 hypothetical protein C3B58_05410 [Lactonifactor longoviformis]SHF11247.1 Putative cell wall binding repeat-containing protein [Lactonifactor longoviformis DSM 17459]
MGRSIKNVFLGIIAAAGTAMAVPSLTVEAANPLLPLDEYIPDVEAKVFTNEKGEERLYLYGSHDDYNSGTWCSYQYRVWSAPLEDLEDWTDHGVSFASRKGEGYFWEGQDTDGVDWSDTQLYAPDVCKIGDTYYLVTCNAGGPALGMATSKNPEGPFSPAKKILYDDGTETSNIDPSLYTEGEGENQKVYLVWGQTTSFGGQGLLGAELIKDENGLYTVVKKDTQKVLFGAGNDGFGYYEGPSLKKINGKYYILYPSNKGKGVHMMSYAIADEPLGPYTFGGNILDNDGCDLAGGNNHGSFCKIKDQWYLFYHRGFGNSNMRRKVCAEKIYFDENGKIGDINGNMVQMTNHGLGGPLSPYEKVEAAYATHVRMDGYPSGCYLSEQAADLHPLINITDGNCVEYRDFDFGTTDQDLQFTARLKAKSGGSIDIVLDDPENAPIGTVIVGSLASSEWTEFTAPVSKVQGIHTVYLKFHSQSSEKICEMESFRFSERNAMFSETFDGDLRAWKNKANSRIIGGSLQLMNNTSMTAREGIDWKNYSFEANVKLEDQAAGLTFRKSDDKNYYLLLMGENGLELKKSVNGTETTVGSMEQAIDPGQYTRVKIECCNEWITVYVNGAKKGEFRDYSLQSGTVGFYQPEGSMASYDDVAVMDTIARVDKIEINGMPLTEFTGDVKTYSVPADGGGAVPFVKAYSTAAKVSVEQAQAVPGSAKVTFDDGENTAEYEIKFYTSDKVQSDDFTRDSVGEFWQIVNPNEANVTYEQNKGLTIQTEGGDLGNQSNPAKNLFLQNANSDWTIETVLSANPAFDLIGGNWPSAGLVAYGDDSHYVKLVYLPNGVELNTGDGDKQQIGVSLTDPNQKLRLKLEKSGNTYTGYYALGETGEYKTFSSRRSMSSDHVKAGLMTTGFMASGNQTKVTFHSFTAANGSSSALPELVPAEGVAADQDAIELTTGDTVSLNASVTPQNATYKDVVWSITEGADAVEIVNDVKSDTIVLKGVREGDAVVRLSLQDNPDIYADCELHVQSPALDSLTVTPPSKTEYKLGEDLDFHDLAVKANYVNGTSAAVEPSDCEITGFDSLAPGEQTVAVSYTENGITKTGEFTVTVLNEKALTGILVTPPAKTEYEECEPFDRTGMAVKAQFSDGSEEEVSEYVLSDVNTMTAGTKEVTVTYEDKAAAFTITVKEKKLTGIEIIVPDKTDYLVGEAFDPAGMIVNAVYSNQVKEEISQGSYTLEGFDSTEPGDKTVVVSYEGNTAEFTVKVSEKSEEPVLAKLVLTPPAKTEYLVGEEGDLTGLAVYAWYSDGACRELESESYEVGALDTSAPGIQYITVSYEGMTEEFMIVVSEDTQTEIPHWEHDRNGWWYSNGDGTWPRLCWKSIHDTWYYFDKYGYRMTGWVDDGSHWYYCDEDGVMQTGWLLEGNTWYYLKNNGMMATGWIKDGNTWYYLKNSGAMATGWLLDRNTWYYLRGNGAMITGWYQEGNTWYYLRNNGAMATGWLLDGNTWYYLKSSGAMETGWILDRGTWYYLKNRGAMATGWVQTGGRWYYLKSGGGMAANQWIGKYYVNKNGVWTKTR